MPTGVELATAWVRIVPSADGVQGELIKTLGPQAEAAGDDAGKRSGKKFTAGMKVAAAAGAAAVAAGVVKIFETGMEELKFGQQISAQTDQLVKNTGFKMKTEEIEDFTLALSRISGVSEEELQQAGNSLIKFGDLSEENYQKAVTSINDLAATGKDAAQTGEMLGKALADPEKAATLLKRSGVLLTEQQKEQIKAFSEAGDKASAQGVILDALEGTYGGMAETVGGTLEGNLNKLNNAWENVAGAMVELVMPAVTAIVDVLSGFFAVLEDNPGLASALAIALGVLAGAFVAVTIATWAMNTALLANPITWIVLAVVALVAGIVWLATQTTFFQDVWNGAMEVIGAVSTWLWENVLEPVFTAIGDIINWVWTYVIKPVVDLVVNYFRFWAAVALWLYENAVKPAFELIGKIFEWVWNNVIKPVVDWIADKINLLGLGFRILYETYVKPAFDAIGQVVSTVWTWIDQHVFTPFKAGVDLIGKAFELTAKAIGIAWDGIKKAAAVPINFVLDTVWNNGLRSFWNDVVGTLGLNDMKLPKAELVKFADGGVENHVAQIARGGAMRLWAEPETGGEAYIPLAQSKRGRSTAILDQVARQFGYSLMPFADGGILGELGSFAGDVWDNVAGAASVAWDFLSDPAGSIQRHIVQGIIEPLMGGVGGSVFGRLPGQLIENAVKGAAKLFEAPGGVGRGTKGMGWQAMWDVVRQAVPGAVMTSGFRPGSRTVNGGQSYHALGRAIDLVPASMATFNAVARMFPNASELIYTPAGRRQLLNGKPFADWSAAVKAQHYNHVHLAMADGGLLPGLYQGGVIKGSGSVVVGERGPEVLNLPQGASVDPDLDAYRAGGRAPVVFNNYAPLGQSPAQALTQFANRAEVVL